MLLRPIFCEKLKIPPPHKKRAPWNVWISEFGQKIRLNFGEDLFFFFFGDHLFLGGKNLWISDFGRKIRLNFGEDLFFKTFEFRISAENSDSISAKTFFFFFGDHLILSGKNLWIFELSEKFRLNFRTNRVKLIQEQSKFGSRSFALFSLFQNSPPLFQILATRLYTCYNLNFWRKFYLLRKLRVPK